MNKTQREESGEEQTLSLPVPRISGIVKAPSSTTSQNFDGEISQSISSLNESAKHMFGLMTGLKDSSDGTKEMTAVEIVKQLANLARVKLDYLKMMKGAK